MIKIKQIGILTERQFAAIIANTVIGVGILTLPRSVVSFADTGGIISTILGSIIFLVNLLIIIKLGLRFPKATLFEYMEIILGKFLAKFLALCIIIYWFISSALIIRSFSELIVTAILPKTPLEITMIIMLLLVIYLTRKDIQVVGRVNELYAFITVIPLLILVIMSFRRGHMVQLFPILRGHSMINILKGTINSYITFSGFEVIAVFIPAITTKKLALEYGIKGWITPTLLSIIIVIASISVFGAFELKNLTWPTFELIKSTHFLALIFERLEVAFIAIWVISIFTTATNLLYAGVIGGAQILNLDSHKTLVLPLLPILYLIALTPRNAYELFNIMDLISLVGLIVTTILPLGLYILAKIRGKKGRTSNEKVS